MASLSPADRAAGCIVGALIGDALGVGPHWYYNLDEMKKDYGEWITNYAAPKSGRYHEGVEPGDLSQTGQIIMFLLESAAATGTYDEESFTTKLDELLSTLDGTPSGGRYTNQSIRDVYRERVQNKKSWGEVGSYADTSEAAERVCVLAALFANNLMECGLTATRHTKLTQVDPVVVSQSTSFAIILAAVIRGIPYDKGFGFALREMTKRKEIPFTHAILAEERSSHDSKDDPLPPTVDLPFPDALLQPGFCIDAAQDPTIQIPPEKVALFYGLACSIGFLLPAAEYLCARFPNSFEDAVLAAINGGGQNMSRACLTGALSGALVGLSGIPKRFIDGLKNGEMIVELAKKVAAAGTHGL